LLAALVRVRRCLVFCLALLVTPLFCVAQDANVAERYDKADVMIPVRDGVELYTEIYSPRDVAKDLPIIFLRTPYRVAEPNGKFTRYFNSTFRELAKQNYIFAVQDARGRHGSGGQFEWNRSVRHRTDAKAIDASTDAYDSIDWLVKNVKGNNGRVGMLGVSYPGWYVTMALIDPHPALRAASPQASPSDYFIGDDFFHFGAFRLGPSAELPYLFDFDPKENSRFPFDQIDTYEFFLDMGPLKNMNERYLHGVSPTWNHFMSHSTYDEYWRAGGALQHLTAVSVPTLNVVGWWDAENFGGAMDIYDKLESVDRNDLNHIVVGPWAHGQWARGPRENLGEYDFGSDTVDHYQREIEAPFFAHHLKDAGESRLQEATMFQTGSNQWQTFDAWPPRDNVVSSAFYLHADGTLSPTQAENPTDEFVEYVSDPKKPVPYSKRPIMGFWSGLEGSDSPRFRRAGKLWKVEDQRFVHDRPDVISFVSEPLETDMELVGQVVAHLHASTTGTDSDWVVKVIDVYPEAYPPKPEMGGFQLMVADDVLRGKFRRSFENPEALVPNEVNEFRINLRSRNHRFRKGHRIMIQIQSSWFPLIDRNPQTFTNIMQADEADYQSACQRVYCSRKHPSHIKLSILHDKRDCAAKPEGDDTADGDSDSLSSAPKTYGQDKLSRQLSRRISRLKSRLPTLMERHHVPGVSVALIEDRRLVWSRGFGVRCVGTKKLVQPDTVMEACSMSKPFYTYLLLKLVERGDIDLDRPLVEYLGKDYLSNDPRHRRITAAMVCSHTTGLPNWRSGGWRMGGPMSLAFEPGTQFRYSGEGFLMLQRAIEKETGIELDTFSRRQLIVPLGLKNTRFVWDGQLKLRAACGHDSSGQLKTNRRHYDHPNAAYSLYTTAEDYARFLVEILKVDRSSEWSISDKMRLRMLSPISHRDDQDADWGLGWGLQELDGRQRVFHSGSNGAGFRCYSEFFPECGDGLVIMTNALSGKELRQAVIDDWHAHAK
jgi:hypothetical protein